MRSWNQNLQQATGKSRWVPQLPLLTVLPTQLPPPRPASSCVLHARYASLASHDPAWFVGILSLLQYENWRDEGRTARGRSSGTYMGFPLEGRYDHMWGFYAVGASILIPYGTGG